MRMRTENLEIRKRADEVGSKETTPTIAEMNPKLPTPPPDLWKN